MYDGCTSGGTCETSGSLSVVIPAYNEAGNLDSLVRRVVDEISGFVSDFEVLIVDDGSSDETGRIANQLAEELDGVRALRHAHNVGYGGALKTGFRHTSKDWVAAIPADHQFNVRDLRQLLQARSSADIISSYRLDRKDSLRRRVVSRLYHWYVAHRFGVRYRDLNWVKMFRGDVVRNIEIESQGFCVDVEILMKARCLGYRIVEVPVDHYPRPWGTPTPISVKNVYRTLREFARIKPMITRLQAGVGSQPQHAAPSVAHFDRSPLGRSARLRTKLMRNKFRQVP